MTLLVSDSGSWAKVTGARLVTDMNIDEPGAVLIVAANVMFGGNDIPEWFVKLKSLLL